MEGSDEDVTSRRATRRRKAKERQAQPLHTIQRQGRTIILKCRGETVAAQDIPELENWMSEGKKWIKAALDEHKENCKET